MRRISFAQVDPATWAMRKDFALHITTPQSPQASDPITDESLTYAPAAVPLPLELTLAGVGVLIGLVGVSVVNLSVLKNDGARAIRFSTLLAICEALDCEVGELWVTVGSSHE